jgi:predicted Zn-dependent protease
MSRTLTLTQAGWNSARALARAGRRKEALAQLGRLLGRTDLTTPLAADARRLAGELELDAGNYAAARRHLRAVAGLEPAHARTQYTLGVAHERDPHGDARRAAARFRRASTLDPGNPLYRAAFGRAVVRCGKVRRGAKELLEAADAALLRGVAAVTEIVVDGLLEAGRVTAARRVLAKARFRFPGHRPLLALWGQVRFEAALDSQTTRRTQDAASATDGGITLLPFVRVVGTEPRRPATGGTVRFDKATTRQRPHIARLRSTKADW